MQTFLPFGCVERSLRRLDHKRLHKQLIEAIQILQCLAALKRGEEPRYRNHPAVLMWSGHETFLRYYACMCAKVIKDSTRRVSDGQPYDTTKCVNALLNELGGWLEEAPLSNAPSWFGREEFHGPHRAALFRKRPEFYSEFKEDSTRWTEYHWPVRRTVEERKAARRAKTMTEVELVSKKALTVTSRGITKETLTLRRTRSAAVQSTTKG